MFGTALRAAGDFIEESFASANSGADADGSVGGKDSAEVESLVAAAIEVAEENAAHFIDLGVVDGGAEGADSGEAVDVDTAIELLDRVRACSPRLAGISKPRWTVAIAGGTRARQCLTAARL